MKEIIYKKIDERVLCDTAKCGLRVRVIPKIGFEKTYALLCTDFGSIDRHFKVSEKDVTIPDGVAHFLEHKMFEQEDGGNAFDRFALFGANANAFTNFDMTAYLFSTAQNYEECLTHLLSYVSNPYYTDENVAKEQGIIGQEIKMYDDSPGWCVFFNMLRALYVNHPINIDIAGTCEEIAKITKETLYTCYKSYYHPCNMMLCVVGNADADKVMRIVDDTIPETPFEKAETIIPDEEKGVLQEYIEKKMSVATPVFTIGFKEAIPNDPQRAEAEYALLCELLFGKSSELYNQLYEEGLIYNMSSDYNYGKQYAFVEISGESENPQEVYSKIKEKIHEMKKSGVNENLVEINRRSLFGSFLKSLNDTDNIAMTYASAEFAGGDFFSLGEKILSASASDINKLLENALTDSALSVVLPSDTNEE